MLRLWYGSDQQAKIYPEKFIFTLETENNQAIINNQD